MWTASNQRGGATVERLHAVLTQYAVFGGGCQAEHPQAEQATQLSDRQPHAARRRVHQHGLATARRRDPHQHVMRGEIDDGEGGALFEAPAVWEREHRGDRNHQQLALPPKPCRGGDAVADANRRDSGCYGVYDSRNLVPDRAGWFRGVGIEALAGEEIGEVDARSAHPDPYRTRLDDGIGGLTHLEDLGRSVTSDDELLHGPMSARIATALAGQAIVNSTDARTAGSTSSRATSRNPNRGKNCSAVVVSR